MGTGRPVFNEARTGNKVTAISAAMSGPARLAPIADDAGARYHDLGTEPPLSAGTPSIGVPARRAVSMRWLAGTILTGVTSFVLVGGALIAALNNQNVVATAPQSADIAMLSIGGNGEKGDRIVPVAAPPATREVIPVSTVVREGDRDLIQLRDYVLIRTALTVSNPDGVEIPAYDPVTIVGEAADGDAPAAAPAPGDFARGGVEGGNAAVRTVAFPIDAPPPRGPDIGITEIEEIVHRSARDLFGGGLPPGAFAYANAVGMGIGAGDPSADPFAALGMRMIPENVSYLGKTNDEGLSRDEQLIPLAETTLEDVLGETGMSVADMDSALTVLGALVDTAALDDEHRVRIAMGALDAGAERTVLRVSIYEDTAHQATVARDDGGRFVRADEPPPLGELAATPAPAPRQSAGALPRLYEAIYLTANDEGVPREQINELVRIFAFDLDMQARIGPADSLTLFHSAPSDTPGEEAAILFAAINSGGSATAYYRFQGEDGVVRYYDAEGRSADNFLLRKPMSTGEMRSPYGNRLHPILGVYRLHSGVDWSAPYGTPIVAAGDGEIVRMEWNSGGYGRFTVIQHRNSYETAYAHQSSFAQGLSVGDTVRQGQVIGYVGSTGLSTGNHLHYEVRINGQTVNPLTIRLPEGDVLTGNQLAAFEEQRDQINDLLGLDESGNRVAAR